MNINSLQQLVHNNAKDKGWWQFDENGNPKRNIPEALALIHSEVSEALEEYRKGNPLTAPPYLQDGKPEGFWVELADAMIRILDLAGAYNIDMEQILHLKHRYNLNRPYRHGDKKA